MIELQIGQDVEVTGRLRLGVAWDRAANAGGFSSGGSREIDLDASAVQFGGGRLFDLAFYNNVATRDGSVAHLGDNKTGSGEGDDETITVDLDRVHRQIDTIFLLVTSYQGHDLQWVPRASCRVVDEQDVELARITLTLGIPETGVVLARISREVDAWRLHALGAPVPVRRPTESERALKRLL